MAGLINAIKNDIKKSGANKGKFIYFREGQKQRIRFLTELDDGMEVVFHDSFAKGINVPCQEKFDRDCKYCEMEGIRTRSQYVWSIWNYETNEVQLLMSPSNNCSPIPALVAMNENYGTIMDRDYVISVTGKQQNKTFSVVPMDKVKFRNNKAKPYSETAVLKMIDKAFPADDDEDNEDEEEYRPKKSKKTVSSKSAKKAVEEDDEDWDEEDAEEIDYEEMTEKELYKLCKKRDIEAKPKRTKNYYINLLEEYDKAQDDWDDNDDEEEDDWDDEE